MSKFLKVFKEHSEHIKIDKDFHKKVKYYRIRWANKNNNHMEFLGGNLLGVYPIRFSIMDEEEFFVHLLSLDKQELTKDLHDLEGINPKFKVTSNPFYLTCVYLVQLFAHSNLNRRMSDDGIKEVYYIFAYRVLSSLVSHYFKYDLDKNIAITVNEHLSQRFLIKRLGTWQNVLEYRADDFLEPEGLHVSRIKDMDTDAATRIIMDAQGRLRDMVKEIYSVIIKVIEKGETIQESTLSKMTESGEEEIGEITSRPDVYVTYLNGIIYKTEDLIKDDLVTVIRGLMSRMPEKEFVRSMVYLGELSMEDSKKTGELIKDIIEVSITYLSTNGIRGSYVRNLDSVLLHLKGMWSSSRNRDVRVKKIKKDLLGIVKIATKKKTKSMLVQLTISISLYLFLRALMKNNYN